MPIQTNGPCFMCDADTPYQPYRIHVDWGDSWLAKQFKPTVRERLIAEMKRGGFNLQSFSRSHAPKRAGLMLNYICRACRIRLEEHHWPDAHDERLREQVRQEREAAARKVAEDQAAIERQQALTEITYHLQRWCQEHGVKAVVTCLAEAIAEQPTEDSEY